MGDKWGGDAEWVAFVWDVMGAMSRSWLGTNERDWGPH